MTRTRPLAWLMPLLALVLTAGCMVTSSDTPEVQRRDVAALAQTIRDLGEGVDPDEAARAAELAYAYSHQLKLEYNVTDPPLIHNTKVNMGLRPRGLCWHWAEDMEKRLRQEDFRTLALHRAIANEDNPMRISHSTAIISRRGDTMFQGVVLDPWREGGELTWAPVLEDADYPWQPQAEVLANRNKPRSERTRTTAPVPPG